MPVRSSNSATVVVSALRRCLVCEWEEVVEEAEGTDPIGAPCGRCRAPTERVGIVARRRSTADRNPHAAALGHLGGLKGGPARAAALTPQRRREIARGAARARWKQSR
jgi:hypothetical protein